MQHAEAYSRAITSAFLADMVAAPTLARLIQARQLDGRGLADVILRDLAREASRERGPVLFPNLRAVLRTQVNVEVIKAGGMSEWAELASAVVGAAGAYVTAQQQAKTQEAIAKLQLQQQQAAAEAQRAALAAAQGVPGATAGTLPRTGEGLPSWLLPAAAVLGIGGVIVYAATR